MSKYIIKIIIIVNCIITYSFAQEEITELELESDGITLIKILTNPKIYDREFVSINGYISTKSEHQEYWNIFLDKGACEDYDSWNSIQLVLLSKFLSIYRKKFDNDNVNRKKNCFRASIQGEFVDLSKINIYDAPVGAIKLFSMTVPFDIEVDKEDWQSLYK